MLTGELRNQIDRIWDAFWSGGISNPLEVIEQITYSSTNSRVTGQTAGSDPLRSMMVVKNALSETTQDLNKRIQQQEISGKNAFRMASCLKNLSFC